MKNIVVEEQIGYVFTFENEGHEYRAHIFKNTFGVFEDIANEKKVKFSPNFVFVDKLVKEGALEKLTKYLICEGKNLLRMEHLYQMGSTVPYEDFATLKYSNEEVEYEFFLGGEKYKLSYWQEWEAGCTARISFPGGEEDYEVDPNFLHELYEKYTSEGPENPDALVAYILDFF